MTPLFDSGRPPSSDEVADMYMQISRELNTLRAAQMVASMKSGDRKAVATSIGILMMIAKLGPEMERAIDREEEEQKKLIRN